MKQKIVTLLLGVLAMIGLVVVASPAQAAPGTIWTSWVCATEGASLRVGLYNPATGWQGDRTIYPCDSIGEGTQLYPGYEPTSFRVPPGWSGNWHVNSNAWVGWEGCNASLHPDGCWIATHPGAGYTGAWHVYVDLWNS